MRDSRVSVRLGDVTEIQTGFPFKSNNYSDDPSDPKLLRGDNIAQGRVRWDGVKRWPQAQTAEIAQYWLQEGDIILAMDRPWIEAGLKYCAIQRDDLPCLLVQRVARLRGVNGLDNGFLRYLIGSQSFTDHVLAVQTGTAVPHISSKQIQSFHFDLPPLPEQRAIAATLGALDDKIALNRKMNATLEAMARALFRDWFVDFRPTRAKMEGRAPYLSPDLWSLFPDRLDSDGKPEGWETGTLGDLATLNPESWSAKRAPAGVRYVDLANTKWGTIDKIEEYDWADAPSRARRILRPGDTIVGTVRPGNGSFAHIGEDGLTGSTGFAVLRPNDPRDRGFVWCAATSPENIDRLAHLADGGAYPAVRPDAVAGTEIVIPDAPILAAFDEIGRAHLDMMEANKRESRTLARTRDLLLPRLMSGELRVAGAETLASKVA